jgi:hypothetical protein
MMKCLYLSKIIILVITAINAGCFKTSSEVLDCQLSAEEISGLESIYNSTNGAHWQWKNVTLHGPIWNFDHGTTYICGTSVSRPWQGIFCNCSGVTGSVVSIDLASYGLEGMLPNTLDPFTSLIALNLESNSLYGVIPQSIGSLISLQEISLFFNHFTGEIPDIFENMQNLTHLSMYSNRLSGSIPSSMRYLTRVQTVYLHENYFTGTIPPEIGQLSSLVEIWLYLNSVTGALPISIGNLTALEKLYLNHNMITGKIPENYISLQNLHAIDLAVNYLSGTLPSFILSFPNLFSISIASNCFHGKFPDGLCQDPNAGKALTTVVMDGLSSNPTCPRNKLINDRKPSFIHGFLQSNTLEGTLPSCVWTLPNLQTFHISGNALQGNLYDIPSDSKLTDMTVSHNLLSGSIPESFQTHAFTQRFDVSSNKLSGKLISSYNVQPSQDYLQLSVNRISGDLPSSIIEYWPNITTFDVLTGNHYQCSSRHLPKSDPSHKTYTCASDDLDIAVYAWFGFLVVLISIASFCAYLAYRNISESFQSRMSRLSTTSFSNRARRGMSSITSQRQSSLGKLVWYKRLLNHGSRAVLYTFEWWKETSSVNLSSYEDNLVDVSSDGTSLTMGFIPQTILFLEFVRILGYWACFSFAIILLIALPFNVAGNKYGFSSVQETYGYVISSVYMRGNIPVIFFSVLISLITLRIKLDSNFHRLKAIKYLTKRRDTTPFDVNKFWSSVVNHVLHHESIKKQSVSSDSTQTTATENKSAHRQTLNPPPPILFQITSRRTIVSYIGTALFQLINLVVTSIINIIYVNSIAKNSLTTLIFLFLQVWIGCFKFIWSNTYIPWATKMLQHNMDMPSTTAMTHRYIMLIVNYIVSPCIATLISNQSVSFRSFALVQSLSTDLACLR